MYKIGIDLVLISRMEKSIEKPSFLRHVFTDSEMANCSSSENFAGIFAVKEAYFKAIGTGLKFPLTDIEVLHDLSGRPYIKDHTECDVSITHDGDYAMAAVIINDNMV